MSYHCTQKRFQASCFMPTASLQCICFGSCGNSTVSKTALNFVRHPSAPGILVCQKGLARQKAWTRQGPTKVLADVSKNWSIIFQQEKWHAQTWTVPKSMLGSCKFSPKSTPLVPSLRQPELGPPVLMYPSSPVAICASSEEDQLMGL